MTEHNIEEGDNIEDWNGTTHRVTEVDGDYVGFLDEHAQYKFTHVDNVDRVE